VFSVSSKVVFSLEWAAFSEKYQPGEVWDFGLFYTTTPPAITELTQFFFFCAIMVDKKTDKL